MSQLLPLGNKCDIAWVSRQALPSISSGVGMTTATKVLIGFFFYPRGGSAHSARAIARELRGNGFEVTVVAGSRTDLSPHADAHSFFTGLEPHVVDFTPAARSAEPLRFAAARGEAPMHPSYEDREGAEDPVFAALGEEELELQVRAWARELSRAGAGSADLLYLNHLTPMHEAAAQYFPHVPVVTHIHGSELLMLERIERGAPPAWRHARRWQARLREWAAHSARLVVNSAGGLARAEALLGLPADRFALVPNGVDPAFGPRRVDRAAHWRRHLVERPQGWRPGEGPGSLHYEERDVAALAGAVLLYCGRFTRVKRLPLLVSAYARARARFATRTPLVLLGGYPGEWEDEHPLETAERIGVDDVFLAGWHPHEELPDFLAAADALVHPSVREQFGQVLVEAMMCGLPVIAVDRVGPASIVEDGESGWLVPPDDEEALADAMVEAVNRPAERRRRGRNAREKALAGYTWPRVGARLAALLRDVLAGEAEPVRLEPT